MVDRERYAEKIMDPIEAALRAYHGDSWWFRQQADGLTSDARIDMTRALEAHSEAVRAIARQPGVQA